MLTQAQPLSRGERRQLRLAQEGTEDGDLGNSSAATYSTLSSSEDDEEKGSGLHKGGGMREDSYFKNGPMSALVTYVLFSCVFDSIFV